MGWFKSRSTAPASARPNKPSRLLLQALEPRLMFDGAAVQTAIAALHADAPHLAPERAEAPTAERLQEHAVPAAAPAPEKQVVFIDTSLANYQGLLAQLPRGAEVVLLESGKDGLAQIAQWAGSHQGYAAMHILSHGQSADLLLGRTALTSAALEVRQGELAALGGALKPGGDILLYGCDIGAGTQGAAFVARLSELSHADVAASSDATGAARLGGNWTLERHNGQIEAAALQLDYDGLLARPVTGTTDFTYSDGNTYNPSGSVVNAGNLQGWDFTLQLGATNNGGQTIIVEKPGSVTTETVDGYSDGTIPISYFSVKSNDSSRFTLNSIGVVLNGYDSGTAGGNLQLVGYINGTAVSGANLTLNVGDVLQGAGGLVTFNVSGNAAFKGIDSFRVLAANGHNVTGMIGIGAINAVDFGFAPALTASGGSAAYSSGTGAAVTVDGGITLSDSDSTTQASATVSVTGGFQSGQDVLAFTNNGSTMGNIAASYNSGTGVLTLTSSGATATLAQWQAALRAVSYQNSSLSPSTANRTISFAINDGAINSSAVTRTVTLAANAAPVLSNLNGDNPTFTEKGGAVKLDAGTAAVVSDSDTTNFNSGALTVHVAANGQAAQDVLGIDTSGTVSLSSGTSVGSVVSVNGVAVGVIASNGDGVNGHDLVVSFNSNATAARVTTLVNALNYSNSSNDPNTATRTVNVSVSDGRGGTGSANVTVAVAAVNDAPTASATALNPTFSGTGPVSVFSGASIATGEGGQSVILLTLTVSGVKDGASEILAIDGSNVALSHGNSVTTSGNGLNVSVAVSGGNATVTIGSVGISAATANSVINGITYRDSSASASNGNRVVTLSGVKDNGGTGNGGVDSVNPALASTVNVALGPALGTSAGSAAFVAGDNSASPPVAVDAGLSVSDPASSTLASVTVAITGNFHSGEDVLAFANDGASMGNIVASYNAGTGVLTLSSAGATATLAQWQAALRAVTYTDSAVTPNTATRTISFQATDGAGNVSSASARTLTVTSTDQTPVATASAGSVSFTSADGAAGTPVVVDGGITLSDRDNTTLASATVAITGNFQSGEDTLAFSNTSATTFGNITASYHSGMGVLTLTSSGATATLAQWQAALRAVSYGDSKAMPNTATRTVSFSVNDGSKSSAAVSRQVTLSAAAQTPLLTASAGSTAFASGDNGPAMPVAVDGGLALSDLDSTTLASATVAITGNFRSGEDVLAFSNGNASVYGNISASYNASTGVLSLSSAGATATLAQWQAALRAVSYTDGAATPDTATRTVSFSVDDGGKISASVSKAVSVSLSDQSPVVAVSGGSAAFVAGDNTAATPLLVDGGLSLSDRDSTTLASASVSISANFRSGQDVLAFSNTSAPSFGNIVASYNSATGVLSLTSSGATATLAQWQAALRAVSYTNSAVTPDTASRSISFRVNDGGKDSASVSRVLMVAATAQTPVLTGSAGSATFMAGDGVPATPVAVDTGLTLSDLDSATLARARVAITGNFHSGEDVLAFSNTSAASFGNIAASYDAATGVLSLTSAGATATLAQWQAALRAVTYTDSASTPALATRTVSFAVSDGSKTSADATRSVSLALPDYTPVLGASGGQASFVVGAAATPVVVDSGLQVADRDSATLASASVRISGNFQAGEDVLAFVNDNAARYGNIAASYNAGSGVLTLTSSGATATVAQWQAVLRAVTYADSAATPNVATRTVAFSVNDGGRTSQVVTRDVALNLPTPQIGGLAAGSDTGASASDGVTANARPTLNGTALASATVSIYVDGVLRGSATADGGGAWTYAFAADLADGHHSVTVKASSGGIDSPLSSALALVIDTVAPASPADLKLTSGTAAKPAVSGKAEAGSSVSILLDGVTVGTVQADGAGAWAWQGGSALADGPHSVRAVATDLAGNASAATADLKFTVDTRVPLPPAPPAPALTLAPGSDTGSSASDGLTSQNRPTLSGTAQADSTVTVLVDGVAAGSVRADAQGVWRYTLSSALADGQHGIAAVAENAGGKSAPSAVLALTIDTAAPDAPAIAGLGANPAQPEFSGRAEANSVVAVYVDNALAGTVQADASGRWSYRSAGVLGEGAHTVHAVATDAAGNSGASSAVRSWRIDGAPPAAPAGLALGAGSDTGGSGSDGVTSVRQPLIVGTVAAGSRVTVSIDGVALGSVTADAQGAWSFRPGAALAEGAHRVTAVAANAAGAASAASAPLLLNIDTGAPRLVAITALDAPAAGAGPLRYEVQFSEAVALTADAFGLALGGQTQASIASITASGEGRYIVQLNASGEGSVALTLRAGGASDLAGNALAQGGAGTAYLLQAPPPLPADQPGRELPPASLGGGTPLAAVPITPPIVLNTVAAGAATVAYGPLATAGESRLAAPPLQAAWGMDRFAGSGVADVFANNGRGGFAARDFQDLGARSLEAGRAFELRLPAGALSTRSAQLAPSIHAQLSDGRALPAWIRFDAQTGRFLGTVPPGWKGELSLEVRAQDEAGHEHVTHLQLRTDGVVEVKADGAAPAPAKAAKGQRDGKPAPAKAALNEQLRQYGKDGFEQQLAAWLAADEAV